MLSPTTGTFITFVDLSLNSNFTSTYFLPASSLILASFSILAFASPFWSLVKLSSISFLLFSVTTVSLLSLPAIVTGVLTSCNSLAVIVVDFSVVYPLVPLEALTFTAVLFLVTVSGIVISPLSFWLNSAGIFHLPSLSFSISTVFSAFSLVGV